MFVRLNLLLKLGIFLVDFSFGNNSILFAESIVMNLFLELNGFDCFCSRWAFIRRSTNGPEQHRTACRACHRSTLAATARCGCERQQSTSTTAHGNARLQPAILQHRMP